MKNRKTIGLPQNSHLSCPRCGSTLNQIDFANGTIREGIEGIPNNEIREFSCRPCHREEDNGGQIARFLLIRNELYFWYLDRDRGMAPRWGRSGTWTPVKRFSSLPK
jgi:hypothetical protein